MKGGCVHACNPPVPLSLPPFSMMSDFDVTVDDDSAHQTADSAFNLEVVFNGPSESRYYALRVAA